MEKIHREIQVNYNFDWRYGVSLSEIKKDIAELEKLGANFIILDSSGHIIQEAYIQREETDEEYNKRMEFIKEKEKKIRKRLKLLAELKNKYETK